MQCIPSKREGQDPILFHFPGVLHLLAEERPTELQRLPAERQTICRRAHVTSGTIRQVAADVFKRGEIRRGHQVPA